MPSLIKRFPFIFFAFLCIVIGLYPISYFIQERTFGLLQFKSAELLKDLLWNIFFYLHIILGGLALMIGWSQFSTRFRKRQMNWHRQIGKIYVISALISGLSGLYIAFFATGGLISIVGFLSLAIIWLYTTGMAFRAIKKGNIRRHQELMIYSYAACFAAVTLRLWMPILIPLYAGEFIPAYRIVAWLSWVPNLIVAYFIVRRLSKRILAKEF